MKLTNIRKLKKGDKVKWLDPAREMGKDHDCSHTIDVKSVQINGEVVAVTDTEGTTIECLANELRLLRKKP